MISKIGKREYTHEAIVDQCIEGGKEKCERIEPGENVCKAYLYPRMRWRNGTCPAATHVETVAGEIKGKQRIGQQKQKKHRKG